MPTPSHWTIPDETPYVDGLYPGCPWLASRKPLPLMGRILTFPGWPRARPSHISPRYRGDGERCIGLRDTGEDAAGPRATSATTSVSYIKVDRVAVADRVCSVCTQCHVAQYQAVPCQLAADTDCRPLRLCQRANEYEASAPTATSDRVGTLGKLMEEIIIRKPDVNTCTAACT